MRLTARMPAATAAAPLQRRAVAASGSVLLAPRPLPGSCLCRRRRQPAAAPAAALPSTAAASAALDLVPSSASLEQLLSTHPGATAALLGDVAEGLEAPVQLAYLLTLMGFLVVGAFLVVRQVLIRRELEEAAKVLGERVRSGEASSEDYFELGVILLRKKLYTQATKNLERAQKSWSGEPEELAQVHNALGFAFFNMEKVDPAISQYRKAVELQPGYVTAWNNLGDAYERKKQYAPALAAYREVLTYAPDNKVAQARSEYCRTRIDRSA
ncbi:Tetratricopeptide repeat domain-containing protein PYG7 [Chlorella vulgaris]